ncbi:protein kinase domain-containing protein [Streptomyces sp. NBC_00147]|uniref:protein kinase domain-containing protein n=1 Tax=Streptomyces sp. NBC_00147 TaxID=2975667 RepID=UPI0032484F66
MADVFHAIHKLTGTRVVLKQLFGKNPFPRQRARMAREIEVGRLLSGHPHAMPVWDADPENAWFVMPVGESITAAEWQAELKDDAVLRALLNALCSVLSAAHDAHDPDSPHGWVHRDIKPSNVLRLDGRWVLADWGLTRRPAGRTSHPQRTKHGVSMGSLGFAAPELMSDPHSAGPPADLYSLGQLIGWAVTGKEPLQNIPLMPDSGPWRAVVGEATQLNPSRRPPTVQAFRDIVDRQFATPPVPPVVRARRLRALLDAADGAAPDVPEQLVALAAAHPDDDALYSDELLHVSSHVLMPALMADTTRAVGVVRAMNEQFCAHRSPERGEVDAVIMWCFAVARHAADAGQLHLLEEACSGAFSWDALWDQWRPQDEIRPWLRTLTGDAASSVAGALRAYPDCARHFSSLADDVHVDHRIRSAVSAVSADAGLNTAPFAATGPARTAAPHGAVTRTDRAPRTAIPEQSSSSVRHCRTLERWGRIQGWWGDGDYDAEYIASTTQQINDMADRLASLTPEARALLTQVLERGDTTTRHLGFPGTETRIDLSELRRRAQLSKGKTDQLFGELERKGFGYIDHDPDFGEAPPEAVIRDSADGQIDDTVLGGLRTFAVEAGIPLDVLIDGRFDLLD